ncbi:ABC transporter substrate-binding protein [Roseibium sp.]|uniref:ABC transporter substrate-binding protein n=1 Tax=Roseibium sp. TaxID=1936156 RepID=UPI003D0E5FBF
MRKLLSLTALGLLMSASTLHAAEKVTVVTSFPKELTDAFEAAFAASNLDYELEILSKGTSAAVKYIQETAGNNTSDIMWASAPDAFEVLKGNNLLAKVDITSDGIPEKIGTYPINDPDGYYYGFAASGYGIMWNTRYLQANELEPAREWSDLAKPEYFGHVGMSAPSRSGTTHLTVETLLQGAGWEKGWSDWKWISGNMNTVTERSFGVPDGVNSGNFGLGVVIDFFGFSSRASGFPVEFAYPSVTAVVPANIGVVANAPNPEGAKAFIEFVLSPEGQQVLFNPAIMRLPVNPEAYANAPEGIPNPFEGDDVKASVNFDADKSKQRYNVVNSLFDVMVTYRLNELQDAVRAVQLAEIAQAGKDNAEAKSLLKEARALIEATPITEAQSLDPDFAGIFQKKRKKASDVIEGRQAEIEQQWDAIVVENYAKAKELADKAAAL